MTNEATKLLRELVACCDAAKDDGFLVEPDPVIERAQAAWKSARAYLSQAPAAEAPEDDTAQRPDVLTALDELSAEDFVTADYSAQCDLVLDFANRAQAAVRHAAQRIRADIALHEAWVNAHQADTDAAWRRFAVTKAAATKLLALMGPMDQTLGTESDRVFAWHEFDDLRAAIDEPLHTAAPSAAPAPADGLEQEIAELAHLYAAAWVGEPSITRLATGFAGAMREAAAALASRPPPIVSGDALHDIAAERERQKSVEGWTAGHDDEHDNAELALAAGCYALHAGGRYADVLPAVWPWAREWWKPTTPRRDLVKAGALIVAEIERLDRAAIAQIKEGAP